MAHDFIKFPELTNSQMNMYYFDSPHKQITEDFRARVVKVTDGDTIRVTCDFRDFNFPIRLLDIDAPEMNAGGKATKEWLTSQILEEEIDIIVNPDMRVGKWGRLLGKIFHEGRDVGEEMVRDGRATTFENRREGEIPEW